VTSDGGGLVDDARMCRPSFESLDCLLFLHLKTTIETLHVGEDALPVGTLHTDHVFDIEQWCYVSQLPITTLINPDIQCSLNYLNTK